MTNTTSWLKVKVPQLCVTLCNPMDYTVPGILQARILEWVAFPFSRGSSQPRDQTQVSHIADRFFMIQLSHLYMTTGKTIALTIWTFVGKVLSLLFNMLSRFVIVFLPRKKAFNFMAAVT